jgi:hypothetical protein
MPNREPWDEIEAGLTGLCVHDAYPERVERIRLRCVAALAAQRRRDQARRARPFIWRGWLEPAVALGLSAIYLAAAIRTSLALLR